MWFLVARASSKHPLVACINKGRDEYECDGPPPVLSFPGDHDQAPHPLPISSTMHEDQNEAKEVFSDTNITSIASNTTLMLTRMKIKTQTSITKQTQAKHQEIYRQIKIAKVKAYW